MSAAAIIRTEFNENAFSDVGNDLLDRLDAQANEIMARRKARDKKATPRKSWALTMRVLRGGRD